MTCSSSSRADGWALRHLHCERELAADQVAVRVTDRPGALASGLLKVIDGGRPEAACAAFMPSGTLVDRVKYLVEEQAPVTRLRGGVEVVAVAAALSIAVVTAMEVPSLVVGTAGDRDAVALVWTSPAQSVAQPDAPVEPRAFQVYRRSQLEKPTPAISRVPVVDDDPREVSRVALAACATPAAGACPEARHRSSLPLKPRPVIRIDDALTSQLERWRATPVVGGDDAGISVYWLQLRRVE